MKNYGDIHMTTRQNIANQVPNATNDEINRVLGRQIGAITGQIDVTGLNPQKINCDDLLIHRFISMDGARMMTPFVAMSSLVSRPGIIFSSASSGFYSNAANQIGVSIAGTSVCEFTAGGVGLANVYALGGTAIDFGGTTIQNVVIMENPGAYSIVGTPAQTAPFASAVIVNIPIALASGTRGAWELRTRTIAIAAAPSSASGTYAFTIRATAVGAVITISAQTNVDIDLAAALAGISVSALVVANTIQIRATGNALTLSWQARTEILKVESS